jgi:hypothetical protein
MLLPKWLREADPFDAVPMAIGFGIFVAAMVTDGLGLLRSP